MRTIMNFGASFLKPMGYDYCDWKDPLPAASATAGFIRATLRRLGSRLRKTLL